MVTERDLRQVLTSLRQENFNKLNWPIQKKKKKRNAYFMVKSFDEPSFWGILNVALLHHYLNVTKLHWRPFWLMRLVLTEP